MARESKDYPSCPHCGERLRVTPRDGEYRCGACEVSYQRLTDEAGEPWALLETDVQPPPEPLNLPRGSVRGLVALSLSATAWALIAMPGRLVPDYLFSLLLTVIAYYFASRRKNAHEDRLYELAPEQRAQPLHLPARSIRLLLIGGFAIALIAAALHGRILVPHYLGFFVVFFGLVGGTVWRGIRGTARPVGITLTISHLLAAVVLVVTWGLCAVLLLDVPVRPPQLPLCLGAVIGFYFGNRP